MKKIVFDNSIHLGQFALNNEPLRIACKNSQIALSNKEEKKVIGLESFNENTYSDDIIWGLDRITQDTFYPFMDVYHSVKNIVRVPLVVEDSEMAIKISKEFGIGLSNALTCAIAIREKANEIHSVYEEFKNPELKKFLMSFNIDCDFDFAEKENCFDENLEKLYQAALNRFKEQGINIVNQFHG